MIIYYASVIAMAGICALLLLTPYFFLAPFVPLGIVGLIILYRYPILGMISLMFFIPFENAAILSKYLSINKLIGLVMIFMALLFIAQRKTSSYFLVNQFWAPIIVFLLVISASILFSIDVDLSLDFTRRLISSIVILFLLLVFFESIDLKILLYSMAASIGLSAFLSLIFSANIIEGRGAGFVTDPNYYAMLILFMLPVAVYAFFNMKHKIHKLVWVSCILFMLIALVNTYSRASILILIVMLLFFAWQNREIIRFIQAKYVGILLLAITTAFFTASATVPQSIVDRFASLSDVFSGTASQDPSLGRRTSYIYVGAQSLAKDPLLGSGIGTFPVVYAHSAYSKSYSFSVDNPDLYRRAHNTYLEIFSETGLLGGFCFLLIMLMIYRNLYLARQYAVNSGDTEQAGFILALLYSMVSMSIFMLFLSAIEHKYLWFMVGVSIVMYQQQKLQAVMSNEQD